MLEDTAAVLLPEAGAMLCINCFQVILVMIVFGEIKNFTVSICFGIR